MTSVPPAGVVAAYAKVLAEWVGECTCTHPCPLVTGRTDPRCEHHELEIPGLAVEVSRVPRPDLRANELRLAANEFGDDETGRLLVQWADEVEAGL